MMGSSVSRDSFHWVDYVVFVIVLVISLFIGSITSCIGGKQKTMDEFIMGDRQMSVIPVSLSMTLSFISAILILGMPAEMYAFGTQFWVDNFGMILGVVLAAVLFVPLLYPLGLYSCYEYLELRFQSKAVKRVGSFFLITSQVIYMGIAIFSPSTALEGATGFPTWASIVSVGVIATAYSSVGGLKGTIWSSVFQAVIVVVGISAVVIVGAIQAGGMAKVWEVNDEWDRIEFFDFSPDPTLRQSFWSLVIGGGLAWSSTFGVNQGSVQRYCSLPTERQGKACLYWNIPWIFILMTITGLSGVVMFAFYALEGCDPLSDQRVANLNQLLPYFIMQNMAWPGFPGLFVSALFAGALSTMAASLGAVAAVTWEDWMKWKLDYLSESKKTLIIKLLVCIYGILGVGMAFLTDLMGGHVLQASLSFVGAAAAPILGLFLLGGVFPWANWIGAVVGGITGLIFPMWISIGAYVLDLPSITLPMPTENCTNYEPGPTVEPKEITGIQVLYTVSFLWYSAIGMATTIIVGLLVSLCTGLTPADTVPKKYLIPFFDRLFCCFPERWLARCRCGSPDDLDEEDVLVDGDGKELGPAKNPPVFTTQTSYVQCAHYKPGEMLKMADGEMTEKERPENPPAYNGSDNAAYISSGEIAAPPSGTMCDNHGRLSTQF